jgi:GDP-D-mannose dehydratase
MVSLDSVIAGQRNLVSLGIENKVELIPANLLDLSNVIRLLEKVQPTKFTILPRISSDRGFSCELGER